jgi:hypothetical protein
MKLGISRCAGRVTLQCLRYNQEPVCSLYARLGAQFQARLQDAGIVQMFVPLCDPSCSHVGRIHKTVTPLSALAWGAVQQLLTRFHTKVTQFDTASC